MGDQASLLGDFNAGIGFGKQLIATAHGVDLKGGFVYPSDVRSFMTEASVLKMYIAWERYVEQTFLSYLMGVPSIDGTTVTSYLRAPTKEHANLVVIGTQKYVDWGNPDIASRLACLYFKDGLPFKSVLASVHADLFDLRAIRNAAAHLSTTTSASLDAVALRRLGRPMTAVTVYDLVTGADVSGGSTVLEFYVALLAGAADILARG